MRTIRKLLIGRSALPGGGGCAASASPAGGVSGVAPSPSPSASSGRRGPVAHRPGDDGGRLRGGILPGGIVEMGVDGGGALLAVPEQPSHRDLKWPRFVGQLGGLIKVYSSCRSCRQNPFESISLPLLLRLWGCGQGA